MVGLTEVIWRHTHGVSFSYGFSLVYTCMWQPRGSAHTGGDDVMAFVIRFSLMARDRSGAGSLQGVIEHSQSVLDRPRFSHVSTTELYHQIHMCNGIFSYNLTYGHLRI